MAFLMLLAFCFVTATLALVVNKRMVVIVIGICVAPPWLLGS